MRIESLSVLVILLGILITTSACLVAMIRFRREFKLNLFTAYTTRYQAIILNLPENIHQDNFDIELLSEAEKNNTLRHMRAYFDLCSEEYSLWLQGSIDDNTWAEWRSGIQHAFSAPAFMQSWRILQLDNIYYQDFTQLVKNIKSDTVTCGGFSRKTLQQNASLLKSLGWHLVRK
ncbi:MAG: hypothetical protein ACI86X_001038 [Moritella sp.]|jgi:hypothetical protein